LPDIKKNSFCKPQWLFVTGGIQR